MGRGTGLRNTSAAGNHATGRSQPAWPDVTYRLVPELAAAEDLAIQVRATVLAEPEKDPLLDLRPLLRRGGFRMELADLAADRGGLEASMMPRPRGGFRISVDPRPRGGWGDTHPHLQEEISRHRLRFRTGHEIAHSFFYEGRGSDIRRRRPSSPQEEQFCDEFARALLVPPAAARALRPTANAVVKLHRFYDVSLQVAARALAAAHPDSAVVLGYRSQDTAGLQVQWASSELTDKLAAAALAEASDTRQRGKATARVLRTPRRQVIWVAPRAALAGLAT